MAGQLVPRGVMEKVKWQKALFLEWATWGSRYQAGSHAAGERLWQAANPEEPQPRWVRDRQIGTSCRVRVDIYLVGYEVKRGKREKARREKSRESERETKGEGDQPRQQLPLKERDGKQRSSDSKQKEDPPCGV